MLINNILQDGIGYIELQDVMGNDLAIVNAARVSYLGESKGEENDKKLLQYLWRHKHTSPFEMAALKLKVHCPLFVRSQWMRHRSFSYNEVSRRYTSENMEFYYPIKWRLQDFINKQGSNNNFIHPLDESLFYYQKAMNIGDVDEYVVNDARLKELSLNYYNHLIALGIAREQARMVLPQSLYTTFIATGNLRNWMHFIKLRSDTHAQWEIQQYSNAIFDKIIKDKFPWVYDIAVHDNMTLL